MLNLVAPVQPQMHTKQPVANTQDYSKPDESEGKQFNNILEREVAEKESTQHAEKQKDISTEKRSETSESIGKTVDADNASESIDTSDSENADSQKITSNTISSANSNNDTTQNAGAKEYQYAAIEQTEFPENTFTNGIVVPPFQVATTALTQSQINSATNKSGSAQTTGSVTAILSSLQAFQQGNTQNALDSNNLWQQLQTANSADSGKALPIQTAAYKEMLARATNESSNLPQIDTDAAIQQPGLSSVSQTFLNSATQTIAPHSISIDTQIGQPKWNGEFAQKMVWLANQQHQVAELRLNPAHLGPVEIMLSLTSENGTQASAQFVSPHLAVREAIEAAMPRLREMMAESGIQLGDVMVSAESPQHQEQSGQHSHYLGKNTHLHETHEDPDTHLEKHVVSSRHNGIVNTFA